MVGGVGRGEKSVPGVGSLVIYLFVCVCEWVC